MTKCLGESENQEKETGEKPAFSKAKTKQNKAKEQTKKVHNDAQFNPK